MQNLKVLIVNDDFVQIMMIKGIISGLHGINDDNIFQALNGEEALEKALSKHFNLILMDLNMPIMDGFEASFKIKIGVSTEKLPTIVAISAYIDSQVEQKC